MKRRSVRFWAFVLIAMLLVSFVPTQSAKAETYSYEMKASDIQIGTYTQNFTSGEFTITAAADKSVVVEESAKTSEDGVSFTHRLKLGGTGSATARSIHFTVLPSDTVNADGSIATVTTYAMSGSSTADRSLGLYNSTGVLVGSTAADGVKLQVGTIAITEPGDYYLGSLSSGVNVYAIKVEAAGSKPVVVRKDWVLVGPPEITSVEQVGTKLNVNFNLVTGTDGADKAVVTMYNDSMVEISSVTVGSSNTDAKVASFTPSSSGTYIFRATSYRNEVTEGKLSNDFTAGFTLPLTQTAVRALNVGNGNVMVRWTAVKEAQDYTVQAKLTTEEAYTTYAVAKGLEATIALKSGSNYDIRVIANRGNDSSISLSVLKNVKDVVERDWAYTYFGQSVSKDLNTVNILDSENLTVQLNSCTYGSDGMILRKGGKLTTIHDGITYYYTEINPNLENFVLTATFQVDYINPTPDGQEGFGILAMDSLGEYGVSSMNHYTNSAGILATKYEETIGGVKYTSKDTIGSRFVTGLSADILAAGDSAITAAAKSVAKAYSYDSSNLVKSRDTYTLTLKKTNTGYHAVYNGQEVILYGADKLSKIDTDSVYVGFAAARGCNVTVSNISFTTSNPLTDSPAQEPPMEIVSLCTKIDSPSDTGSENYNFVFTANAPGNLTLKDAAGAVLVDNVTITKDTDFVKSLDLAKGANAYSVHFTPMAGYQPYENAKLNTYETQILSLVVTYKNYNISTIHVSPNGTPVGIGTKESPLDIDTATKYVQPGQKIELAGGTYLMTSPLVIARGNNGTQADRKILTSTSGERAILDFSNTSGGMQVWGDYWLIDSIDVCKTIGNVKGLQIAGDYNVISRVNTYLNGDTGLQISGSGSEGFAKWPSNNLILNCTSYDNCDPGMNNADGFAAKLTCGEGNVFRGCIAYNNLDDGWDLFSKMDTGKIGAVVVENCVAFSNGTLTSGVGNGDGNGFKMGGDGLAVAHVLKNSIAFANNHAGITSNSNPALQVINCTTYGNLGSNIALYGKGSDPRLFVVSNLISMNGKLEDTYSEMPSLASVNNYFCNGVTTMNSLQQVLSSDIFLRVDVQNVMINRATDGSIRMNGLFELKSALGIGATLDVTPITLSLEPTFVPVVEPTLPPVKKLEIKHVPQGKPSSNTLMGRFYVKTLPGNEINVSKLTLRYYFTADVDKPMNLYHDYSGADVRRSPWYVALNPYISYQLVKMATPTPTADYYVEITYSNNFVFDSTGKLELCMRLSRGDWSKFDQTNDYSYLNGMVAIYDGQVISGNLPQ